MAIRPSSFKGIQVSCIYKSWQTHHTRSLVLISLLLVVSLSACRRSGDETPVDPDVIYTSAAITANAKFTVAAGETAVAELTQMAGQPTATLIPPTPTPPPTAIFIPPTPTPAPIPTAIPYACDWAELMGDVSVPPGTNLPTTADFINIWRAKNVGSCTWTSQYALVFVDGTPMTGSTASFLPGSVQPGQIIDLSVNQTAPNVPGMYQGNWMLRNASNTYFGTGERATDPFQVLINAYFSQSPENYAYDFGTNYCAARWRSQSGPLGCPGVSGDFNGSAILLENPNLESRPESRPALWTRPDSATNGWISGIYPAYTVKDGDRFQAEIGCLNNSPGCDVLFLLDYETVDGLTGRLGSRREFINGQTSLIDINLSSLAGQSVRFILTVNNLAVARDANAFWLTPHIERFFVNSVLDWTQEGRTPTSCDGLRLFWTSEAAFRAEIYSCTPDQRDLGGRPLSTDENAQVFEWVNRLKTFDAEIYQAKPDIPIKSQFTFSGRGITEATNADIGAINNVAERLFLSIIQ
ncbi:MAG: NBR1-Ig-like domain-containing protein [Anaerolineales bacterium]